MSEKLKKCPFCGGEAEVMAAYYIDCKKCFSRTQYCNSRGEAIQAWNTRVEI